MIEPTLDRATHTYRVDGRVVPGITKIIKSAGLVDDSWFTEYSRERGSAAHLACQLHDEDDLDEASVDPVIVPYLEAWKKFRAESGFRPTMIEESLYSPTYGFAGTPDRYGILNGDEVIIEIKTGGISFVTGIQLAAQRILFANAMNLISKKRFAVQLTNEGKYKLTQFSGNSDFNDFLSCLAVHNLKVKNGLIKED